MSRRTDSGGANRLECVNCGDEVDTLYPDYKTPPIEVGDCLCKDCALNFIEEAVEELEDEISCLNKHKDDLEDV